MIESTKTIQLKIINPDEDLVETINKYTEGMNYASEVVYASKKLINAIKMHKITYRHLRENIGLKSQCSCTVQRQVAGTYRTLANQIKKKQATWQKIVFKPNVLSVVYKRDFTITPDYVAITTFANGRKKYRLHQYGHMQQYFQAPWRFGASKLVRHHDGNFYFHLTVSRKIDPPSISDASTFMGIDVGINCLAVASTTDKKCRFFAGGEIKDHRNKYTDIRKRLQSKGTRSAKRVLKRLSRREQRHMRAVNHDVSRGIIRFATEQNVSVISMEDLTGIRQRTNKKVPKSYRYKHSSWAFAQLQDFIEYKANDAGIIVMYIDPRNTSRTCSRCNHISKNNRKGLRFRCEACNHQLHADLNAARNIEHRSRDLRYTLESQGCMSATHTNACVSQDVQAPCVSEG